MKSPFCLLSISLATTLLVGNACTHHPANTHYVIQGELPDSTSHGKVIYLFDYNGERRIDSTTITGNCFRFEGEVDTTTLCRIDISRKEYANLILEGGQIIVYPNQERCNYPSGTPLNDEFSRIQAEEDSLGKLYRTKRKQLKKSCASDEAFQQAWAMEEAEFMKVASRRCVELYSRHNDDPIGMVLICSLFMEACSLPLQDSISQNFGPWLASTQWGSEFIAGIAGQKNTAEGMMFTDLSGHDMEGNKKNLSDYVGKGNYVLMDMWASWCGPCLSEIPHLAMLHERYGEKGLTVLGLFVADEASHLKPIMEKEHIGWPQIIDTEQKAMSTYGVDGIPHIILFAPDGIILKRGLRGQEMIETIHEIMNQTKN